jgi:hypothetical protein
MAFPADPKSFRKDRLSGRGFSSREPIIRSPGRIPVIQRLKTFDFSHLP